MITKISIKDVASYGDTPAVLETNKRVNLVYGLNGSGKTTISNFLADKNHPDFVSCSIEGLNDEKVFVYNHNFIQNNFYLKNKLKGIFTLSTTNKEAEEKIKNAEKEINEIDLELNDEKKSKGLKYDLVKKDDSLQSLKINSEEKIWEIKTTYAGGDRVLEFCLIGNMGSKTNLFDFISKIKKPTNKPKKTIEDLKNETETTQGANAKKYNEEEIKKINFDFEIIENNAIFSEVIVGNKNSIVAELIKQLNNADWVKQGVEYLPESIEKIEKCPFCQQETITQDLHAQIKTYFDDTYQKKVDTLKELEDQYWGFLRDIPKEDEFLQNPFLKNKEKDFKLFYKNLTEKIRSNWSLIKKKKEFPSQIVTIESTKNEVNLLNNFFDEIIVEIKGHNLKIDNKDKTKDGIETTFWQIMRWDYDQTLESYNIQKKAINNKIFKIKSEISRLEGDKTTQKKIIEVAQKEIVNVDESIKNINDGLKDLGADGFQIEKVDDNFYQIKRDGKFDNQFESLSEGEKTIISFLYFLELCKGKESEDEVIINKIVVIDDPISSLSHIYIFNISQLIKWHFFKKSEFKQIFVLTHSLYFFHELLNGSYKIGKENKLFRITKSSSNNSIILNLNKDEIRNDYQSYWQVIKDHNRNNSSDTLLANAMRNILEYFFGFIEKDEYTKSIEQIDKQKYQPFIRYINRESHSDFTNISDTKEIDVVMFKSAFKEVFEKSGHQEHYKKMIRDS